MAPTCYTCRYFVSLFVCNLCVAPTCYTCRYFVSFFVIYVWHPRVIFRYFVSLLVCNLCVAPTCYTCRYFVSLFVIYVWHPPTFWLWMDFFFFKVLGLIWLLRRLWWWLTASLSEWLCSVQTAPCGSQLTQFAKLLTQHVCRANKLQSRSFSAVSPFLWRRVEQWV